MCFASEWRINVILWNKKWEITDLIFSAIAEFFKLKSGVLVLTEEA